MPINIIRSAPIVFDIRATGGSGIWNLQFLRQTEVLRGVCRLVMCLKISERFVFFWKTHELQ